MIIYVKNNLTKEGEIMSKRDKFYRNLGQAVCNLIGGLIFVTAPMAICNLGGYIANIIL